MSDADLVRQACRGDREAFGSLVLNYQDAVFDTVWRILRNREDAEDASQETFVRAWRALGRFDPDRPFRPWILRIAVNMGLKARSKRRNYLPLNEAMTIDTRQVGVFSSPVDVAGRHEVQEAIDRMVDQLPPGSAALFQLRYGEQLPLEEIARILDRRPGTLAVALHRIRERFRRALFGPEKEGR